MRLLPLALLLLSATPAFAQQSWQSESGEITYLQEIGTISHWRLVTPDRQTYDLYLQGAGSKPQQGFYQGYWLDKENAEGCRAEMIGAEGWSSQNWGEVAFDFDQAGSPGVITIYLNNCFGSALDREPFLAKPSPP